LREHTFATTQAQPADAALQAFRTVEPQFAGVGAGIVVILVGRVGMAKVGKVGVGIDNVVVVPFTTTVPPALPPRVKARASTSAASSTWRTGEAIARAAKAQTPKMLDFIMKRREEI